ncbi:MAG TPA: RDD family protein [Opitutaceae bacterium]|nr:RDD family protein [Opitutaceae bacterium]
MQWYYANDNQRMGPVGEEEFQRLVTSGIVRADTLVWRQGMANWMRYAEVAPTIPPPLTAAAAPLTSNPAAVATSPVEGAAAPAASPFAPAAAPFTYPQSHYAAPRPAPRFHFGGFWIRFVAKFIDGLILNVVCLVPIFVYASTRLRGIENFDPNDPEIFITVMKYEGLLFLAYIGLSFAYNWFFLAKFAATPGKLALGLRVVRADGSALGRGRIIGRYFAEFLSRFIFNIGYIIAAFDDEKRALHDHICDTRVIKKKAES